MRSGCVGVCFGRDPRELSGIPEGNNQRMQPLECSPINQPPRPHRSLETVGLFEAAAAAGAPPPPTPPPEDLVMWRGLHKSIQKRRRRGARG